jgi:hypothetical protein
VRDAIEEGGGGGKRETEGRGRERGEGRGREGRARARERERDGERHVRACARQWPRLGFGPPAILHIFLQPRPSSPP